MNQQELKDGIERAWGIIANVNGGNWENATLEWQEAAKRWRDEVRHKVCKENYEKTEKIKKE